jgi:tetratricopeptide (TPR) repeat protein
VTNIKLIHRQAMEQSDLALLEKRKGSVEAAARHLQSAFELESQAANALLNELDAEPTRSVLYRSAATLAKDCGRYLEAEKLINRAMGGNPPGEIADELRDLLEQVNFQRHLELRGVTLGEDEIQMVIAGNSVGFGMAPADEFLGRVRSTETLLYRTAERKQNRPYRDVGRRDAQLARNTELYLSVPRAASFAVTFRVGGALEPSIPGLSPNEAIIDEVLDCLQLYTQGDEAQLKARIKDEAYFVNFVSLARTLQPDGAKVNMVGFTSTRRGETKQVALTQAAAETPPRPVPGVLVEEEKKAPDDSGTVEYRGVLLIANAKKKSDQQSGIIEIVTAGRESVKIVVPPGMMSDIVKPLWESEVEVTGMRKGKKIYLMQIRPAS